MAKAYGGTRDRLFRRREDSHDKILRVINEIRVYGYSKEKPFAVGSVEKRMKDFAVNNNISLAPTNLYMTAKQIQHAIRNTKPSVLHVSDEDLANFPKDRTSMRLLFDTKNPSFLYLDGLNKFVVHPNYEIKINGNKTKTVNFITADRLTNLTFLNGSRYIEIKRKDE